MITIHSYWQFLPHWAGPMIINNFHKAAQHFQFNITNSFIYPNLIAITTDLSFDNIQESNFPVDYEQIIVEKKLPQNSDFIDNLKKNLKDQQVVISGENYKIIKKYSTFYDLMAAIVDYVLTVDVSYPKNIGWSNIGPYTCPRPVTGYGYQWDNKNPVIIKGHCFPIEKYYNFSWQTLENPSQRLKKFTTLWGAIDKFSLSLDQQYENIYTLYNPQPLWIPIATDLPQQIIKSCLKNHNNAYLIEKNNETYAVVFIHGKSGSLDGIIKGYQDTINIRLEETYYYYLMDKNQPQEYWDNALKNIMFFEDKIHMGHKKNTIDKLLKYLFKLQNKTYENRQLNCYLWDLNSRIVQEFNDLQGFMSSHLFDLSDQDQDTIYNFYLKNTDHHEANILTIANGIFDSMMTLGLGGIMTPHKDPYNLKGTIDQWLNLLIKEKITIDYQEIIDMFSQDYHEKFFWKNAINAVESRWILLFKNIPVSRNKDIIGYAVYQEIKLIPAFRNKDIIGYAVFKEIQFFEAYVRLCLISL